MVLLLHEDAAAYEARKTVLCPKCGRGKIGSIPASGKAKKSRRGKPPPGAGADIFAVKCTVCGANVALTLEN
jgi:endogenous inhibitor of DNA gyrase (YacG/DUF329 family)